MPQTQADQSNPYLTAYVVYGLAKAKEADFAVEQNVLERGVVVASSSTIEAAQLGHVMEHRDDPAGSSDRRRVDAEHARRRPGELDLGTIGAASRAHAGDLLAVHGAREPLPGGLRALGSIRPCRLSALGAESVRILEFETALCAEHDRLSTG